MKFRNSFLNQNMRLSIPAFSKYLFYVTALVLVAICGLWISGGMSAFTWVEVSEMIPFNKVVDTQAGQDLHANVYFIRQNFQIQATPLNAAPEIIGFTLALLGLGVALFSFLPVWQAVLGATLWFGIVAFTLSDASFSALSQIISGQIFSLSLLALAVLSVLSAASIPSFLLGLSHSSTTAGSKKNRGILGLVWGINLLLTFSNQRFDMGIRTAIPAFIWVILALGVYGYQNKDNKSLLGICLLGLSSLIPLLAIESWNLINQVLMGLLFPLFIYRNFGPLVIQNLPIHKVIHKAVTLPLYLIQIGVLILSVGTVFAFNSSAYHLGMAAKENYAGDVSSLVGDKQMAEIHYKNATLHSRLNTKSNLSLAALAQQAGDTETFAYYVAASQSFHRDPALSVALANVFATENRPFDALFTLQKSDLTDPRIATQLALQYERLAVADSAVYFYDRALSLDPDNPLYVANKLYAESTYLKRKPAFNPSEDLAIQANLVAAGIPTAPMNPSFVPSADLRDLVYLYNGLVFWKGKAPLYDLTGWQRSLGEMFPELALLKSWQAFYHAKPLEALNQLNVSIAADTTQGSGMTGILAFWKYATAFPVKTPPVSQANALMMLEKYPFQIPVLQQALPLVPTKKGYEAALAALQWNEQNPVYYPIYAFQALKMGEIMYADEAMKKLRTLNVALFQASQASYLTEKQRALEKTKF
jgi:tetratricopeptide (TPR) repeat protein